MPNLTVRDPVAEDFAQWRELYRGYAEFYEVEQTDAMAETVWAWILDPAAEVSALLAVGDDGDLIGLAHYRPFARPLSASVGCYLDDLFVAPARRGSGAAELLLGRLADLARDNGWSVVRWITAENNYRARSAYDRLAKRTPWITYDLAPAPSR